jgi:hypothetical protein
MLFPDGTRAQSRELLDLIFELHAADDITVDPREIEKACRGL